ncbi:MAG TPA: nucleoside deaminase [Bacillota bacterium]|jgi:tRNA(adenine34) deaminase|nr:nucleoside deaminase [Bacillota bacterium]
MMKSRISDMDERNSQAYTEDQLSFFMEEALAQARLAELDGEVPIGAVIVQHGQIIARGKNSREESQDATGHAEIDAIRQACHQTGSWRLNDCDLFVTLEPCLMCAGAIIQARIRHLYFGASDPKSGMAGSAGDAFALPANHTVRITGGLLAGPCGDLLRSFFERKRNKI